MQTNDPGRLASPFTEGLVAGAGVRRISVYRVLKSLGDSAVGRAVTRDVLALVVKHVATRLATRATVRYVPLAGQAMAATLSFAAIKYLGERHIRDCMTVANRVIDLN